MIRKGFRAPPQFALVLAGFAVVLLMSAASVWLIRQSQAANERVSHALTVNNLIAVTVSVMGGRLRSTQPRLHFSCELAAAALRQTYCLYDSAIAARSTKPHPRTQPQSGNLDSWVWQQ